MPTATVPSALTSGVTSISYQWPLTTDPIVPSAVPSAGRVFQVSEFSVHEVFATALTVPPVLEGSVS